MLYPFTAYTFCFVNVYFVNKLSDDFCVQLLNIAWYTLARMISEDPALENRRRVETRPEGIMICCRHCGKFLIRRSNRQEFCDSEECQRARNARKQMAYRKRKAGNESEKKRKQRKTKE